MQGRYEAGQKAPIIHSNKKDQAAKKFPTVLPSCLVPSLLYFDSFTFLLFLLYK